MAAQLCPPLLSLVSASSPCPRHWDNTQLALTCSPLAGSPLSQAVTIVCHSTGCPSQPSLSLSLAGPYSTLKTLKLECFLLKKAWSPAALWPAPPAQQSRALARQQPSNSLLKGFPRWTMKSMRTGTGFLSLRRFTKVTERQFENVNSTISC